MNMDDLTPPAADGSGPAPQPAQPGKLAKPEDDPVAKDWAKRIKRARKHWEKVHKRMAHNRKVVAGFNWQRDPTTMEFVDPRANLMFATAQATLPNIYARNPDVSISGTQKGGKLRLFCDTLQTVISRQAKAAKLKKRMKLSVLSAMISYFGIVKVTYQRDLETDPIIDARINDTQDNIEQLDEAIRKLADPDDADKSNLRRGQLQDILTGIRSRTEVVAAEGIVIDRVLSENLIFDDSLCEFDEYEESEWMAQLIPMRRGDAQARFKVDLASAINYKPVSLEGGTKGVDADPAAVANVTPDGAVQASPDDQQICVIEIWDKKNQLVRTMVDGCNFWVRDPYAPELTGERWYPFFILPYSVLPGTVIAPCLVDLTEKLQSEYNETRDKFAEHRELNQPGWVADAESINERTLKRHRDAVLGEITLLDAQGKPLQQVIMPKQPIPINPVDYDTGPIRSDWEQVTGLQDAARSTVVQPKTATEANIQQQSLSGRTSEFRDKLEDLMQEMYQYIGQILLQTLTKAQVERYTGPNKTQLVQDPISGGVREEVVEKVYDWPTWTRDQIFSMVEIGIVAGTSGEPDKAQQQQIWIQAFPLVQQLVTQIMQLAAQRVDYSPLKALLEETIKRFDDRIDIDQFLPAGAPPGTQAGPAAAPGIPGQPGPMPTTAPAPGMAPVAGLPPPGALPQPPINPQAPANL